MLPLPTGDFKAYLFDCDGTIVDSMPQHYLAWRDALDRWGCAFPEDLFYAWAGRPTADIVVADRESRFQELLPTASGIPGVLRHIDDAYGRIPFAVVSGSTREAVTASLTALDILDRFDVLVCAGDYSRPKPDPEPFLRAAELLAVPPEACLVFEDADLGIEAATAAGMAAVRVPPPRRG